MVGGFEERVGEAEVPHVVYQPAQDCSYILPMTDSVMQISGARDTEHRLSDVGTVKFVVVRIVKIPILDLRQASPQLNFVKCWNGSDLAGHDERISAFTHTNAKVARGCTVRVSEVDGCGWTGPK